MTSIFEGLTNISSLNSSVDLLKLAQQNTAGLDSSTSLSDPANFQIQMEQSFNQMLNTLISPSNNEDQQNSSDPFSFLNSNSDQNSLLTQNNTNTATLQQLNTMESNSALLGRVVTYLDQNGNEQKSAAVSKITFTQNLTPILNLSNGETIAVGAVTSISNP